MSLLQYPPDRAAAPKTLDEAIAAAAENIRTHYSDLPMSAFHLQVLIAESITPLIKNVLASFSSTNSPEVERAIELIICRLLRSKEESISRTEEVGA